MARVTIEDCIKNVENRFQLVHLTARRVRQFRQGAVSMSDRNNKDIVLALREIAAKDVSVKNIDTLEPGPREDLDLIQPFEVSETETG